MLATNLLLAVVALTCVSVTVFGEPLRRVCYYDAWASNRQGIGIFLPVDIDPFVCTHIIYSFAVIKTSTGLLNRRFGPDIQRYIAVNALKSTNPELKVFLQVSGASMAVKLSTFGQREIFINSTIDYLRQYGFDGLDVSYTDPNSTVFKSLSEGLRAAYNSEISSTNRLLLSASMAGKMQDIDAAYDVNDLKSTVMDNYDFINLVTYDLYENAGAGEAQHHSRLLPRPGATGEHKFLNMKFVAEYYELLGVPRSMINIGLSTFGRGYTLASSANYDVGDPTIGESVKGPYSNSLGYLGYYEICMNLASGSGTSFVDDGEPYYVNGDQWVGYDNADSLTTKVQWVIDEGFGGTAVWSISFDDFDQQCNSSSRPYQLINTMKDLMVAADNTPKYRRVCYYSTERQGRGALAPSDVDPYLCTHIIVAFAVVNDDNELVVDYDNDTVIYEGITNLTSINPNLKVLLSVGGWIQASTAFSWMAAKPKRRRKFVNSTIDFLREHKFDGIEIDWMYPTQRQGSNPDTDKANYAILIKLLRQEFDAEDRSLGVRRLLLTAAVAAEQQHIDYAYDVPNIAPYVDFISIATIDMHGYWDWMTGHHSALRPFPGETGPAANLNMDWSWRYWEMLGVSKDKINIVVATYGRGFILSDPDNDGLGEWIDGPSPSGPYTEAGFLAYYDICDLISNGGDITRVSGVPYFVNESLWIGYDDEESIRNKMQWLVEEELGGVTVWSLELDDFSQSCGSSSSRFPLISTIMDVLLDSTYGNYTEVVTTYSMTSSTTMSSTTTGAPFIDCTGPHFTGGPFVNINDCYTFYKCSHGVAHLYVCPANLKYDDSIKTCNYPSNVVCPTPEPTTPTTPEPTTPEPTTPPPL